MDSTLFLARLYGVVFLVMGLSMVVNRAYFKHLMKKMVESDVFMFFGGIMALVVGMSIITFHSIWNAPLAAVISFFGWIGLLKGILLILFPEKMKKDFKDWFKSDDIVFGYGVMVLILGLILSFFGFFV